MASSGTGSGGTIVGSETGCGGAGGRDDDVEFGGGGGGGIGRATGGFLPPHARAAASDREHLHLARAGRGEDDVAAVRRVRRTLVGSLTVGEGGGLAGRQVDDPDVEARPAARGVRDFVVRRRRPGRTVAVAIRAPLA